MRAVLLSQHHLITQHCLLLMLLLSTNRKWEAVLLLLLRSQQGLLPHLQDMCLVLLLLLPWPLSPLQLQLLLPMMLCRFLLWPCCCMSLQHCGSAVTRAMSYSSSRRSSSCRDAGSKCNSTRSFTCSSKPTCPNTGCSCHNAGPRGLSYCWLLLCGCVPVEGRPLWVSQVFRPGQRPVEDNSRPQPHGHLA